ncbi:MAG: hypothetical protein RLZZ193_614, partial [Actinomycetota bacterium]
MKEVNARLGFLLDVGLDYLSLARPAGSLSGGEAQRIRLATQIGSGLVGVLYVLDEPSIGLHQRDNKRLIETLTRLRNLGNTLIVVEHDEETIRTADWIVDSLLLNMMKKPFVPQTGLSISVQELANMVERLWFQVATKI